MVILKLFSYTFFAALVGVIPPGLVNMTVAKTCLERGKRNGIIVAIGASFTVIFQALIAIILSKRIFKEKWMYEAILNGGFVIFTLLATYFFIKAYKRSSQKKIKLSKHGSTRSFFKGVMISAFNILPIPYFCAIATAINSRGLINFNTQNILYFICAAALGTYATLHFYAYIFLKIEVNEQKFARNSNYLMSGLMGILMIITAIRIFNNI